MKQLIRTTLMVSTLMVLALGVVVAWFTRPTHTKARGSQVQDLNTDVGAIVRTLPGVVRLSGSTPTSSPRGKIIHLLDRRLLPPEVYALEPGPRRPYEQHLADVESVQTELTAVVRALVRDHGLKQVLAEGLTPEGVPAWQARVAALTSGAATPAAANPTSNEANPAQQARDHQERLRRDRLQMGALGWLLAEGEKFEVLPLEEASTLEAADPLRYGVPPDANAVKARRRAMVKRALRSGPVAVLLLSGEHDLGEAIREQGGDQIMYIRVEVGAYNRLTGK